MLSRLYCFCLPTHHLGFLQSVVFDELHFQKFIDMHLSKEWYFDIHPPLGKIILAYGGYALGYRPDRSFRIEKIGDPYPPSINFYVLRLVSAGFSVATVPLAYIVARFLSLSIASSSLCGVLVLTDLLGTIEGRHILMDSQLLFFLQLALLAALYLWRTTPRSMQRWFALLLTGSMCGLAFSIKHTALATPGVIAVVSFFGAHFPVEPLSILECLFAGFVGVVTYILPFYPYLMRQWTTGGTYDLFLSPEFQKSIIGSKAFDPEASRPSFWRLFLYINRRMVSSNAGVTKRHSWESVWYQWAVNWRGVLYYSHRNTAFQGAEHTSSRSIIYLIGNPAGTALCLLSIVVFVFLSAVTVRRRGFAKTGEPGHTEIVPWKTMYTCLFLFGGWVSNLVPYALVDRSSFIYHYLPGLFYAQLLCASLVDALPPRARILSVCTACAMALAAFVFWSPWVYAWPLTDAQHAARQWLPRWT